MDAGPSTTRSDHVQTSKLTVYYPATTERTASQSPDEQADATSRKQHQADGQTLVPQLVGGTVWRDVLDWDAQRAKGKGRAILRDDEMAGSELMETTLAGEEGGVSSTRADNASQPPTTRRSYVSYMADIPPPPPRSAFSWIPDVPILDWGEPETFEEALPLGAEDEGGGWWFENEGRHAFSSTASESDTLPQARQQLREKERKVEAERIWKEALDWKGDWSMMGRCVEFTPQPHFCPFLHPSDHASALPPLSNLTAVPSHAFALLLPRHPSAPPFPPSSPGRQRGRWIIPINGPILGLPPSAVVSSARMVDDPARISRAEDTLRKRTAAQLTAEKKAGVDKPKTLYWTPTLLVSFHSALTKLRALNALGPVSFKLQRSNIVRPDRHASKTSSVSSTTRRDDVLAGDHWVVWVDLAYALKIRHVLGSADLRIKETKPEDEMVQRVVPLRGARLMLLDDVGRVLGFS